MTLLDELKRIAFVPRCRVVVRCFTGKRQGVRGEPLRGPEIDQASFPMPQMFHRQHNETEKRPVAHRHQREIALGESYADEARLSLAFGLLRVQPAVFAGLQTSLGQRQSPENDSFCFLPYHCRVSVPSYAFFTISRYGDRVGITRSGYNMFSISISVIPHFSSSRYVSCIIL